jgi:hypothetical protein
MIRYLLDTDVTSHARRHKPNENARAWLASVNDDELAISVITLRERLEGAEHARQANAPSASDIAADVEDFVRAYSGRILPLNEDAARHRGSARINVGYPELEGCTGPRRGSAQSWARPA